jgi:hypothetical protein
MLAHVIPMMLVLAVVMLTVAGCARTALPYKPAQQPPGATVSAAYQLTADRVRIEIDTDGHRLEEAVILRPDAGVLPPQTIEQAPVAPSGHSGVGIGVGVGGGSGGVGVGTGVSVGVPVSGSSRVEGTTLAYFPLAYAGPAPWRVRIKLAGIEPVVIVVGPTPPAKP